MALGVACNRASTPVHRLACCTHGGAAKLVPVPSGHVPSSCTYCRNICVTPTSSVYAMGVMLTCGSCTPGLSAAIIGSSHKVVLHW